ncbi:hypothetical protein BT69DRAFT_1278303 [Atractiella rhizophila]|nr:hypothetical protein BT69DRAFT_1278303 [Atractiella rhizophila]
MDGFSENSDDRPRISEHGACFDLYSSRAFGNEPCHHSPTYNGPNAPISRPLLPSRLPSSHSFVKHKALEQGEPPESTLSSIGSHGVLP